MSAAHNALIETAKEAIRRVNGDTSVPPATTLESLGDIRDELDVLIDAVRGDVRRAERGG